MARASAAFFTGAASPCAPPSLLPNQIHPHPHCKLWVSPYPVWQEAQGHLRCQEVPDSAGPQIESRRITHISAEQKRRFNIKLGFDTLHSLVSTLSTQPSIKVSVQDRADQLASSGHAGAQGISWRSCAPRLHQYAWSCVLAGCLRSAACCRDFQGLAVGRTRPHAFCCLSPALLQVSKATTLQKTAEYICKLQQERAALQDEAQRLREQIEELNSSIK